jgi:hypothetical protein
MRLRDEDVVTSTQNDRPFSIPGCILKYVIIAHRVGEARCKTQKFDFDEQSGEKLDTQVESHGGRRKTGSEMESQLCKWQLLCLWRLTVDTFAVLTTRLVLSVFTQDTGMKV